MSVFVFVNVLKSIGRMFACVQASVCLSSQTTALSPSASSLFVIDFRYDINSVF